MSQDDSSQLPFLNVFEVEDDDGATRHIVAFVDPVLGGSIGLRHDCIVGEFDPDPDGRFDANSLRVNPEFLFAVDRYMNEEVLPLLSASEQSGEGEQVVLDPRFDPDEGQAPTTEDVLGFFSVDGDGTIVPGSFRLNGGHTLFDPLSGLFYDPQFYAWLNPEGQRASRPD
jgi:hypothetical protein